MRTIANMNEIILTQDVSLFDFIIRASIVIGWIAVFIIDAIQRHKEKREHKRMYEEWLKGKTNSEKES